MYGTQASDDYGSTYGELGTQFEGEFFVNDEDTIRPEFLIIYENVEANTLTMYPTDEGENARQVESELSDLPPLDFVRSIIASHIGQSAAAALGFIVTTDEILAGSLELTNATVADSLEMTAIMTIEATIVFLYPMEFFARPDNKSDYRSFGLDVVLSKVRGKRTHHGHDPHKHWKTKVHKKRLKELKEPAYTVEEAERAGGLGREERKSKVASMDEDTVA
ncbi:Bud site selection protein 20 [Tulasnella sp. 330]|nr:Bud site selection protein 20 [Tulasnella sp. 330]